MNREFISRTSVGLFLSLAACACTAQAAQKMCTLQPWLPPQFEVVQVETYGGHASVQPPIELDNSGHEVKRLDVIVNSPGKSIVLVLNSYDPVVWNVAWTPGTRVVGAAVRGYHGQAIMGIPKWIPLLISSYEMRDRGSCSISAEQVTGQKAVATIKRGSENVIWIGNRDENLLARVESSRDYTLDEFAIRRASGEVPAGPRGIAMLVQQGYLRPARGKDLSLVKGLRGNSGRGSGGGDSDLVLPDTYVVLKPVQLPDGLYGAHSVTLIIPRGVPFPGGPRGHNTYYMADSAKCDGTACGR